MAHDNRSNEFFLETEIHFPVKHTVVNMDNIPCTRMSKTQKSVYGNCDRDTHRGL
jgi:hypothetical protein